MSWNTFKDHFKGSLVGHSDNNASEDTGHLKVTYHHSHFGNVYSRIPSLRFGTGHFFNNYADGADTACHSRRGAQTLVENNVFRNTKIAVTTNRSSDVDGYANLRGNDLGGAATEVSQVGSFHHPAVRLHRGVRLFRRRLGDVGRGRREALRTLPPSARTTEGIGT
ncbi:hypothetical protein GCM10017771_95950 [Streptomyces capitiformicae]|uniref:Pectate lyase domain-containing protein n=1 Tax=Streptomyces capitiformicae TaxID=2014920 RepID=A0A918ZVC0_9ACTN|nr:hypothetical protein GCM10017771_95950 [Streptomyces capitiformicae]